MGVIDPRDTSTEPKNRQAGPQQGSGAPTDQVGTRYIWPRSDEALSEAVPPVTHPLDLIKKHGFPETLPGTDQATWVAYFPERDFTVVVDKKSDVIVDVCEGRRLEKTTGE